MDEQAVQRAVARMARELVEQNGGPGNLALLGIHRRGVQIADLIRSEIERAEGVTAPISYEPNHSALLHRPLRPNIGTLDSTG